MDMKSFNMKAYTEFVIVPYRPMSGALAKDLKNTFIFTMDSLQVGEINLKEPYANGILNRLRLLTEHIKLD